MTSKDLSLVIPVYNEEENLVALQQEIKAALDPTGWQYEVIYIDDGSRDTSYQVMCQLVAADDRVVALRLRRNTGQTAAFAAGFDYATGAVVVTLDADRQNDPADIPALVRELDKGFDVANGWRKNRQDGFLFRRFPSIIANRLIAWSTDVHLHDRGCSLRAMRAPVVKELHLYGEMHRFIPELINGAGFTMTEVVVNHRPRVAGVSKYGLSRTFRVIVDLTTILFLRKYADRPMHLFGGVGMVSMALGGLLGGYLSLLKLWAGITDGITGFQNTQIGDRPLLLLAVMLIIVGVQFFVMGLLAELLVRTYYESQDKRVYAIKEIKRAD